MTSSPFCSNIVTCGSTMAAAIKLKFRLPKVEFRFSMMGDIKMPFPFFTVLSKNSRYKKSAHASLKCVLKKLVPDKSF